MPQITTFFADVNKRYTGNLQDRKTFGKGFLRARGNLPSLPPSFFHHKKLTLWHESTDEYNNIPK